MHLTVNDAPPWTLRFLTDNWDAIAKDVKPGWMPVEGAASTERRRLSDALGCGHYGCVFSTNTPGLVMKVSSDPSEAEFIKAAIQIGDWPDGIVRYQAVLDLPGSHRNRPVFVIWREEAFEIGKVNADRHAYREFLAYHEAYRNAATYVRKLSVKPGFAAKLAAARRMEEWAWNNVIWEDGKSNAGYSRPPSQLQFLRFLPSQRLAAALRICGICFDLMEHTDYAHEVGAALGFYLDHGVLLADVHFQNIGKVTRSDPGYSPRVISVITDPGHAVFLR